MAPNPEWVPAGVARIVHAAAAYVGCTSSCGSSCTRTNSVQQSPAKGRTHRGEWRSCRAACETAHGKCCTGLNATCHVAGSRRLLQHAAVAWDVFPAPTKRRSDGGHQPTPAAVCRWWFDSCIQCKLRVVGPGHMQAMLCVLWCASGPTGVCCHHSGSQSAQQQLIIHQPAVPFKCSPFL
jgi:hypothetical protein